MDLRSSVVVLFVFWADCLISLNKIVWEISQELGKTLSLKEFTLDGLAVQEKLWQLCCDLLQILQELGCSHFPVPVQGLYCLKMCKKLSNI